MNDNVTTKEFKIILSALLNQAKSKKQINSDIKTLEQVVNSLRLVATFSKSATKKELNTYIKQLEGQLSTLKLKAKIDSKNLKNEINQALNSVSYRDIDLLNIDESKIKLKAKKVIADTKAYVEKTPILMNIELKKEKLDNQLTTYLSKNSKIRESEVLLKEADKIRDKISTINDKNSLRDATDSFQLFKSEVQSTGYQAKSTTDKIKNMVSGITKIGSMFGVASIAVNNFIKSLQTLKSNDTILTEISKTSEMTKQQLVELGNESFKTASKFGQLSSNYLVAVQEMARSGYEDTSKELGELSLLAQSAGDMTAENANNFLLATDAAYKYSGSIEKLNAALDGANYISNKNSASLTDIADGIRVSASYAANAGVAIDELTAAEATMIATTKRSGSEMGRAFRSIILNLQQISGEFDGEVIDEEQLKKVENRCHSLGVELEYLKDGVATLRNPMEILKDLAEVYNSLPDSSADKQGLISDLGGKYHANALSSLLSRWDLYEKMLAEYSRGTGSALEEANKTADSWEGRLNSLRNSWDSFVNSLTNKSAIKGGISFFDKSIQSAETLVDTLGEIPVLMTAINTAMVAMNKDYGLTQVVNPETNKIDIQGNMFGIDFSAIKAQKKHFKEAGEAISIWNQKLDNGATNINAFNNATVSSNAQLKEYLSTCSKDAPASLSGYKAYLNAAGVGTDALRLKTVLLNAAISFGLGVAIQGVTWLVSKGIGAIDDYIHRMDIARDKLEETTSELKNIDTELENVNSQIDEILAKDKIEIVDENELKKLREEVGLLEEKKKLLEAQEYEQQQETNRLISEKYNENFKTAIVATPDGSIIEKDALSYFEELYKQAEKYSLSKNPLTDEEKLNFESIKNGAIDLGLQLTDLLEDFKPLTAEEEKQKEAMEAMLHYATEISNMYAGTSYEVGERLVEKFASGTDANSNKLISEWINSLSDEDKRIMVKCELDDDSLDDLKAYLKEQKSDIESSSEPVIPSYDELSESAESATNSVDTLRSAILSVNDAFSEQAENGSISVDTMLSLVDAGYATALQFDEVTGACTINKEAMLDLVQAKIQNQIEDLKILQTDIASKLKDDGLIASESAKGFITLAKSKAAVATAEQLDLVGDYNDTEAQIKALENAMNNLDKISSGSYSTKKSSSTTDAWKEAFQAEYDTLKHNLEMEYITEEQYYNALNALNQKYFAGKSEYLDEYRKYEEEVYKGLKGIYKDYVESYLSYMKQSLESSRIDYKTYSSDVAKFLKDMYDQGKIAAKDYHDYTKEMLSVQKDAMDGVISAVVNRLDKEIDSYEDQIDEVEKRYQTEIDYIDTVIKYYEDQKKALQDSNDELDRQKALEEALYNLKRAQNQRTKALYTADKGKIYTTDTSAIRDAEEEVRKSKLDIGIAKLDEAIEKLEQQQDALQDAMDREKEQLQEVIDRLENYKDQWNSVTKEYENAQNELLTQQILGANWETDIINGRVDVLNTFRNNYISIQQSIANAAWASANSQIAALNAVKAAEASSEQTSGGTSTNVGNSNNTVDEIAPTTTTKKISSTKKNTVYGGNGGNIKTMQRYGTGTDDAEQGVHMVGEGTEIIRTNDGNAYVAEGEQLHYFEGGETVINASESAKILANMDNLIPLQEYVSPLSGMNIQPIDYSSMVMSNLNIPDFSKLAVNRGESTTISIGDIHLHEVQNVDTLAKQIVRDMGNKVRQETSKHKLGNCETSSQS